jgi:hypothetical protein
MFKELISDIKTVVQSVGAIKSVYSYPLPGNPAQYPAVIFFPETATNAFETTRSNIKEYRFKMWVVVNLNGTNENEVFNTVLPTAVDAIIEKFDETWNGGTTTDGSRITYLIETASWGLGSEQKSKEAYAEINIRVKFTNSI